MMREGTAEVAQHLLVVLEQGGGLVERLVGEGCGVLVVVGVLGGTSCCRSRLKLYFMLINNLVVSQMLPQLPNGVIPLLRIVFLPHQLRSGMGRIHGLMGKSTSIHSGVAIGSAAKHLLPLRCIVVIIQVELQALAWHHLAGVKRHMLSLGLALHWQLNGLDNGFRHIKFYL